MSRSVSLPRLQGVLACVLMAGWLVCCSPAPEREAAPTPVRIGRAEAAGGPPAATYTGSVRARWQTDIGFRVGGKIVERLVEVGSRTRAGQPLARLDPTGYESEVRAASAELLAARGNLVQARADLDRTETLVRKGWATPQLLETRRSVSDQGQGRLDGAEARLKIAQDNLAYTELRAESDGVITSIPTEVGQVVQSGQTVLTLARSDELEAVVPIPEGRTEGLAAATPTVTLWSAATGRSYAARLRELSPAADPATRTYSARFSIVSPDDAVQLGATASVQLAYPPASDRARQVTLPASALFQSGNGAAVWRYRDGRLQLNPVEVVRFGQERVVLTGLEVNAEVVTAGVHKLDPGARVRIAEDRQ